MKVLHLESGRHLYGGARQVEYLVAGLARRGVESVLVCRPDAEIARAAAAARVRPVALRGDLDWPAVRRLRVVLRAEQPDVLHVHSRAGADLFGALAARAERVPALVTRRVDQREPVLWARAKFRRYAGVAAISSPIRAWLVDNLGLPCTRVTQITSAVDDVRFAPRARARPALERTFGFDAQTVVLGAVGQLIPRKGHDVLVAAMPAILAAEPRAALVIFGRGPLERRLRAEIERLRLGDRVQLAGFDPALERVLAGLDLLCHPARAEGLGLAVLEAMRCGVPVCASRVGGLVDIVCDGASGVLVPPDDATALAVAVTGLLADRRRRAALAAQARRCVDTRHSIDAMAGAYLDIYEQLVAEHARAAH